MMTSSIVDWKILTKFSKVNFRKNHESLDQFDKSVKSYIKMFEVAALLALPSSQGRAINPWLVPEVWCTTAYKTTDIPSLLQSSNVCRSIVCW